MDIKIQDELINLGFKYTCDGLGCYYHEKIKHNLFKVFKDNRIISYTIKGAVEYNSFDDFLIDNKELNRYFKLKKLKIIT